MHPIFLNLMTWSLILAQGLVAVGAGQTLCIPFRDCGHHVCNFVAQDPGDTPSSVAGVAACGDQAGGCGHHHGDAEHPDHDRDRHHHHHHHSHHHHPVLPDGPCDADHQHDLFGGCGGAHADCECHLHVALPDADLPWCPIGGDADGPIASPDVGRCLPERAHRRLRSVPPRWIDAFLASDQIKARAVTRLLV